MGTERLGKSNWSELRNPILKRNKNNSNVFRREVGLDANESITGMVSFDLDERILGELRREKSRLPERLKVVD